MGSAELERVTRDAVEIALADFPLSLANGWDHGSLAARVRDSLAQPLMQYEVDKERASNASVKAKISIIARHSKKMRSHLDGLQYDARSVLKNPSNYGNFLGYLINSDFINDDIDLFLGDIQRKLEIFEAYLNNFAKMIKVQKAKWNVTQIKNLRIKCGEALIDVFEDAFGRKITLNNWCNNGGDARHKKPTPFMAFYQSVMFIISNESVTPNLADILKEARTARIKR